MEADPNQENGLEIDLFGSQETGTSERRKSRKSSKRKRKSKSKRSAGPLFFQAVGASEEPCLLYSNSRKSKDDDGPSPPWATIGTAANLGQTSPSVHARMIHSSTQSHYRAQARWYYPMDFAVIRSALETNGESSLSKKKKPREDQNGKAQEKESPISNDTFSDNGKTNNKKWLSEETILETRPGLYRKRPHLALAARRRNSLDPFRSTPRSRNNKNDEGFWKARSLRYIEDARATMLLPVTDDSNDLDHLLPPNQATPATKKPAKTKSLDGLSSTHVAKSTTRRPPTSVQNQQQEYRHKVLEGHRKYDNHPYLPGQWKILQNNQSLKRPKAHLPAERIKNSFLFAQQRLNLSDPCYLAPFPLGSLEPVLEADMIYKSQRQIESGPTNSKRKNRKRQQNDKYEYDEREPPSTRPRDLAIRNEDNNNEKQRGNCLVCLPCTCPACVSTTTTRSPPEMRHDDKEEDNPSTHNWCLLHPIGDNLDTIAASTLRTPRGLNIGAIRRTRRNITLQKRLHRKAIRYNELPVGDTLQQILQCGDTNSTVFLARTSIHVTVFSVVPLQDDSLPLKENEYYRRKHSATTNSSDEGPSCWGTFQLTELQRIDLRSFCRSSPSYTPIDMTAHPKFSGSIMASYQYKFAILSYSKHGHERNVIHHFLWSKGDDSSNNKPRYHVSKHVISNLNVISDITFRGATVLWAVATSYIRPALAPDRATRLGPLEPRLGHGYSLYTIDLRTNEATFQWSPSAEDFLAEGIYSISGIKTEWNESTQSNALWVNSVSAGKMWELDVRLYPLRVIRTWSLPSLSDDFGTTLPTSNGLYGHGVIMARPNLGRLGQVVEVVKNPNIDLPMLCVSKSQRTFGVQLYQRPTIQPCFQTDSLECAASPALSSLLGKKHSVSTSSVIPLPCQVTNKNDSICGLAPVCLPVSDFIDTTRADSSVDNWNSCFVSMILMTTNGDIFVKSLLGSRQEINGLSSHSVGLPVGGSSVSLPAASGIPIDNAGNWRAEAKLAGGLNLCMQLGSADSPEIATGGEASNEREECNVRPFHYSDLRFITTMQQEMDQDGSAFEETRTIKPIIPNGDIAICRPEENSGDPGGSGQLEVDAAVIRGGLQQALLPSNLSLERDRKGSNGTQREIDGGSENKVDRSDITSDILDFANDDWNSG